jgi:hypothetical protein
MGRDTGGIGQAKLPAQGFTVVHPSGLPLACSPRVEREPSGLFPGLHTPPLPAAHAGVGTGIVWA